MIDRLNSGPKNVITFAHATKERLPDDADSVDRSGQAIISRLREAAALARETCERALVTADHLAVKLRATEDRVTELEFELQHYRQRVAHAEKWLLRVDQEIQEVFFGPDIAHGHSQRGNQ